MIKSRIRKALSSTSSLRKQFHEDCSDVVEKSKIFHSDLRTRMHSCTTEAEVQELLTESEHFTNDAHLELSNLKKQHLSKVKEIFDARFWIINWLITIGTVFFVTLFAILFTIEFVTR